MDRGHERRDAGAMQERDMGSRSHLTTQKGDRMQMDIQSEVQCRRFRQPLQSTTRSEMLRKHVVAMFRAWVLLG